MLEKIIYTLLKRRHFWRYATFDEVAELYASRTLRIFAQRMVAVFIAVYLLQEGYAPIAIVLLFAGFYAYKALTARLAVAIIGRYGPKHATFTSNLLLAASFPMLATIELYGWYALVGWMLLQGFSSCMYDLAYLVDFSKVKHVKHAGKELGFMNILEKTATATGPLVGGLVAFWFGPETMMIVAAVILLVAAVPLFHTAEPVRTHQKLQLKGFPWRTTWRSMRAEAAIGVDLFTVGIAWSMVMVLLVFTNNGDEVFAKVGALTSLAILSSIVVAYVYGKVIDGKKGGKLLRYASVGQGLVHLARPFVSTPLGIGLINVINEVSAVGYAMSFMRGLFDTADSSGRRLTYLFFIEIAVNTGAALAALVCAVCLWLLPLHTALIVYFTIASVAMLGIASARFTLYRR